MCTVPLRFSTMEIVNGTALPADDVADLGVAAIASILSTCRPFLVD